MFWCDSDVMVVIVGGTDNDCDGEIVAIMTSICDEYLC